MFNDLMTERKISQEPAIELFKKLGYIYISPEECLKERGDNYSCILKKILKNKMSEINSYEYNGKINKFSKFNIEKAINDLDMPIEEGLGTVSEKIYNKLIYGQSYEEEVEDRKISFDLNYIDWTNENNVFHVTDEFYVESNSGEKNAVVDIVLFVNGIPFCAIECKSAIVSVEQGIEQSIRNQGKDYIPQLFKFTSLIMSSNKNEVKYGTILTAKKFYGIWNYEKDEKDIIENKVISLNLGRIATYQDYIFTAMLSTDRLLEITKYYTIFDANVKKVCRYQQFYAVKSIIKTVNEYGEDGNRKSGVVWHTQGSGKSLTMVMLAKYLLDNIKNSKIIIVTDRKELDKQIAKTFSNSKVKPARATSGKNLVDLIVEGKADVITAIINKFNTIDRNNIKSYDKDIFVLVDESHRSNYGELSVKMRRAFPNASYIGFTGTPLMKNEKTAMKFGGNYIHKYTIKDGVDDKVIVPLIYEGRFIEQIVDEKNIDLWFEKTCAKLNDKQKEDLKRKWSSIQKLNSSIDRIGRIMLDIEGHYLANVNDVGFKAMLATNSKLEAIRYYNSFKEYSDLEVAACISAPDDREGYEEVDDESEIPEVKKFWNDMMKTYGNVDEYEDSIKNKFCDGDIDILIVCSKLLTGFDAPLCQVLYIDKELKEHNLLQAIARTNRLYENEENEMTKDYGLIVDYRGLLPELSSAMNIYSGNNGLDKFDKNDLNGFITDVISSVAELRQSYSNLESIFTYINNKKDEEEYEVLLESNETLRQKFYNDLCDFGRNLSLVLGSENAYSAIHESDKNEIPMYKDKFIFYSKLRKAIKIRCAEILDNAVYGKEMRNLLDKYLSVNSRDFIVKPVDIMDKETIEKELDELGSNAAKADAIRHNISKNISENRDKNPAYYDAFSKRIKEVLDKYKDKVISDAEYFSSMNDIMNDYRNNKSGVTYPENVKGKVNSEAFYGVILSIINEKREFDLNLLGEISNKISDSIEKDVKVDWRNNLETRNRIAQNIDDIFWEYEKKGVMKLDNETLSRVIENVLFVAIKRY